jgi:hypothetical protein
MLIGRVAVLLCSALPPRGHYAPKYGHMDQDRAEVPSTLVWLDEQHAESLPRVSKRDTVEMVHTSARACCTCRACCEA